MPQPMQRFFPLFQLVSKKDAMVGNIPNLSSLCVPNGSNTELVQGFMWCKWMKNKLDIWYIYVCDNQFNILREREREDFLTLCVQEDVRQETDDSLRWHWSIAERPTQTDDLVKIRVLQYTTLQAQCSTICNTLPWRSCPFSTWGPLHFRSTATSRRGRLMYLQNTSMSWISRVLLCFQPKCSFSHVTRLKSLASHVKMALNFNCSHCYTHPISFRFQFQSKFLCS